MRNAPIKRRVPLAADLPRVTGYYSLLNRVVVRGFYEVGAFMMRHNSGALMLGNHMLLIMRVVAPRIFGAVMMRRDTGAHMLGRQILHSM